MSSYTNPEIVCRLLLCGRMFELLETFVFYTRHKPPVGTFEVTPRDDGFYDIIVKSGLITDFASTPRLLWSLLPPIGRFSKAAVVHDYLYINQVGDRAWADKVFLEAMQVSGVGALTRYIYYWGVRALGWVAWRKWARHQEGRSNG
jgi:hypothetical protein